METIIKRTKFDVKVVMNLRFGMIRKSKRYKEEMQRWNGIVNGEEMESGKYKVMAESKRKK